MISCLIANFKPLDRKRVLIIRVRPDGATANKIKTRNLGCHFVVSQDFLTDSTSQLILPLSVQLLEFYRSGTKKFCLQIAR